MYLTKKEKTTVTVRTIIFVVLAVLFFLFWRSGTMTKTKTLSAVFFWITAVFAVLDPIILPVSLGVSPFLSKYNKLVENDLRPAEYLEYYNKAVNAPDLVVKKPDLNVLKTVMDSYEFLNDEEGQKRILAEMLETQTGKYLVRARLTEISLKYSEGRIEEADAALAEIERSSPDAVARQYISNIRRYSRAKATGDYLTAETYCLTLLGRVKKRKALCLAVHYGLAEIYAASERYAEAKEQLAFCTENGGETAYPARAKEMLDSLPASAE